MAFRCVVGFGLCALLACRDREPVPAAPPAPPSALSATVAASPKAVGSASASVVAPPFARPLPPFDETAPAHRFAGLGAKACRAELERRKLPFSDVKKPVTGPRTPLRLAGALQGVTLHLPASKSPFGIVDCRLALVLDEVARVLASAGVTAVQVDNVYRPGARVSGKRKKSQHAEALAVDILSFTLGTGVVLEIEPHWNGRIGEPPCGPGAGIHLGDDRAVRLRNVACELVRTGLFHHVLTPNHDAAHHDHLHLDLEPGEKSRLVE